METINADDAFKLCSKAAGSWAGYHEVQKKCITCSNGFRCYFGGEDCGSRVFDFGVL